MATMVQKSKLSFLRKMPYHRSMVAVAESSRFLHRFQVLFSPERQEQISEYINAISKKVDETNSYQWLQNGYKFFPAPHRDKFPIEFTTPHGYNVVNTGPLPIPKGAYRSDAQDLFFAYDPQRIKAVVLETGNLATTQQVIQELKDSNFSVLLYGKDRVVGFQVRV